MTKGNGERKGKRFVVGEKEVSTQK